MKKEYKKFEAGFQEEVVDLLVLTWIVKGQLLKRIMA